MARAPAVDSHALEGVTPRWLGPITAGPGRRAAALPARPPCPRCYLSLRCLESAFGAEGEDDVAGRLAADQGVT